MLDHSYWNAKEYFQANPELHASLLAALINAQEKKRRVNQYASLARLLRQSLKHEGWIVNGKRTLGAFAIDAFRDNAAIVFATEPRVSKTDAYLALFRCIKVDGVRAGIIVIGRRRFRKVKAELEFLEEFINIPVWIIAI